MATHPVRSGSATVHLWHQFGVQKVLDFGAFQLFDSHIRNV